MVFFRNYTSETVIYRVMDEKNGSYIVNRVYSLIEIDLNLGENDFEIKMDGYY